MFKNLTGDGHVTGGGQSSSTAGQGVASAVSESQESPWIGLLSLVSRPALSLLQKYLPGSARQPGRPEPLPGWMNAGPERSLVDGDRTLLKQLDALMAPQHVAAQLTALCCEHGGTTVPWISGVDAMLGMESFEDYEAKLQQNQCRMVSSSRSFLSQVLLNSVAQESRPLMGMDWITVRTGESRAWWSSFGAGEENSRADLVRVEGRMGSESICPQPLWTKTKDRNVVFVGETTGGSDNGDSWCDNDTGRVQNTERSTPEELLQTSSTATPELDNGYSSLEEELILMNRLVVDPQEALSCQPQDGCNANLEQKHCRGETSSSTKADEEEGQKEEVAEELTTVTALQCQNKAIAFIMGCPCSDDDDSCSQSDNSDSSDEDDDGFDSEGSSELSSSSDEADEDSSGSDNEEDSEADRLWNSLCQSLDPYNPRNFTATRQSSSLRDTCTTSQTCTTLADPAAAPSPTPASTLSSSPDNVSSPAAYSQSAQDSWDDSTSASEVDESESLRLWSSFSSSDPYSPLHFQAPLRTRRLGRTPGLPTQVKGSQLSPPVYQRPQTTGQVQENRQDSGFSELSVCGATIKKVRFCEHVEEFFASCSEGEEDRRGPWEELARDRCRFLRRCQEVEQSISFCLQPEHRQRIFLRLTSP